MNEKIINNETNNEINNNNFKKSERKMKKNKISVENFYENKFKEFEKSVDFNVYHLKNGFERYCVSENGNVYSLKGNIKIIKAYNNLSKIKLQSKVNKSSYKIVKLIDDFNQESQVLVHHLSVFAKQQKNNNDDLTYKQFKNMLKSNGLVVDHIDSIKNNNVFNNLQILSFAENLRKYHNEKRGY